MRLILPLTAFAAMAVASAPAFAQDGGDAGRETRVETRVFVVGGDGDAKVSMDKDGDGFISRDEFTAPLGDAWAKLDKDGDGRVAVEELRMQHGPGGEGPNMMFMRHPGGPGAEGGPMAWHMQQGDGPMVIRRSGPDGETIEERRIEMRMGEPGESGERTMVFRSGDGEERTIVIPAGPGGEHAQMQWRMLDGAGEGEGGERNVIIMGGPGGEGGPMHWQMMDGEGEGEGGERRVIIMQGPGGHAGHGPMPFMLPDGAGERNVQVFRFEGQRDTDANDDGRVSEEEFLAPMREAFRKMDKDGSGSLEEGERGGTHMMHRDHAE